jgi:hypothetical protein
MVGDGPVGPMTAGENDTCDNSGGGHLADFGDADARKLQLSSYLSSPMINLEEDRSMRSI